MTARALSDEPLLAGALSDEPVSAWAESGEPEIAVAGFAGDMAARGESDEAKNRGSESRAAPAPSRAMLSAGDADAPPPADSPPADAASDAAPSAGAHALTPRCLTQSCGSRIGATEAINDSNSLLLRPKARLIRPR